jgi:hypothetical protein
VETHVYLHKNGGFPTIHKNARPVIMPAYVYICDNTTGLDVREYDVKDIFRIDVLMENEND